MPFMDPADIAKSFVINVSEGIYPPTRPEPVWTVAQLNKLAKLMGGCSWDSYPHSGGQLVMRNGIIYREWVYFYGGGYHDDIALMHVLHDPAHYIKNYPRGVKLHDFIKSKR